MTENISACRAIRHDHPRTHRMIDLRAPIVRQCMAMGNDLRGFCQ
jgi:hypothetical protein